MKSILLNLLLDCFQCNPDDLKDIFSLVEVNRKVPSQFYLTQH